MFNITVILPTYNPNSSRLERTLDGLKKQSLSFKCWELIVIDNNSDLILALDLDWHPNFRLIREEQPGLTHARLKGFIEAKGDIIIMVDDDNVLNNDYLDQVLTIFSSHPTLGAAGGKSIARYDTKPPKWIKNFHSNLALRDLGDTALFASWNKQFPAIAPIGAGMAIKKDALETYIYRNKFEKIVIQDRKGSTLSSGGDNDIIIEILKAGWKVGYIPDLSLKHIIPKERTSVSYLAQLTNQSNKSWVKLLDHHHINPWQKIPKWTVKLRKIKAWFGYKAWKNEVSYIRWRGACGIFDALSEITEK